LGRSTGASYKGDLVPHQSKKTGKALHNLQNREPGNPNLFIKIRKKKEKVVQKKTAKLRTDKNLSDHTAQKFNTKTCQRELWPFNQFFERKKMGRIPCEVRRIPGVRWGNKKNAKKNH